ncbi:hypothetical protein IR148_10655 [Dysgonomonas mossii]|uniref:DUF2335 domain-containing protein n=2 Tax=Dysgonomonadaceae TaxID=2005520 RepID=A0A4Y9ILA5_9BACT|nr:hypothetical protein [Dysgonomonas mossii]TFU89141.1 hypothetical protein E4T88_10650 [Dysgonomonas mossii]
MELMNNNKKYKYNDMNMQDDKIRELLSGTRMKASDNLKYRIMHQIEAERALMHEKSKVQSSSPFIGNMFAIFGVMYALIAIVALVVYFAAGKDALQSAMFFAPILLIASACGMFGFISVYDDRRRSKHKAVS